jgi:hypothetical protein
MSEIKVAESPYNKLQDTYTVKFWYTNDEGFYRQGEEDMYASSKDAHREVEQFSIKALSKYYKNFRIISVVYQ